MSKAKLKVVALERKPASEAQSALRAGFVNSMSQPSPIVGYALITFHENGGYITSYHCDRAATGINTMDMPEAVHRRLRREVDKSF